MRRPEHTPHWLTPYAADICADDGYVMFRVQLAASSTEAAEAYLRKVYPDISEIYIYEIATDV